MEKKVVGNCGKHPGFSMVDCPMCQMESKLSERTGTFTPGPWYAVEYSGYYMLQNEEGYCESDLLNIEKDPNAEENAILAAKAPEMYEKLRKASKLLKQKGYEMFAKEIESLLKQLNS